MSMDTVQSYNWTGGGDGFSWHDADNWSPAHIPGLGDSVHIAIPGSYSVQISSGDVTIDYLEIGNATGDIELLIGASRTLEISNGGEVYPEWEYIGSRRYIAC